MCWKLRETGPRTGRYVLRAEANRWRIMPARHREPFKVTLTFAIALDLPTWIDLIDPQSCAVLDLAIESASTFSEGYVTAHMQAERAKIVREYRRRHTGPVTRWPGTLVSTEQ